MRIGRVVELSPGHCVACHIPRAELEKMEPVIVLAKKDDVAEARAEESPAAE